MATRLAPTISPDTEFFWNGLREHKLLIQRCKGCGAVRNPPYACRANQQPAENQHHTRKPNH